MRALSATSRTLAWTSIATMMSSFATLALTALALAASLFAACSPVDAAEFSIVNASPVFLQHLYVSPCDAGQWGPDQLAEPLPPSRLATVSGLAPGCYDIQFIVAPWNNCVIAGASLRGRTVWKVTQWTVFGSQSGDCSHIAGFVPTRPRHWAWPSNSAAATSIVRAPIIRKD